MAIYKILDDGKIAVDGARIVFRNFKGEANTYNRAGDRNFALVIDNEEFAQKLTDEGWNVHIRPPREDDGEPFIYLPVSVSYRISRLAPKIFLKKPKKDPIPIEENDVANFDDLEYSDIKMVINPRHWVDDRTHLERIKAYLIEMWWVQKETLHFYEAFADDESPEDDLPFSME